MPTVPLAPGQVADPFRTKVRGKDQSRPPPSGPPSAMRPSPTEFAMAAATMHELGRLFEPLPVGGPVGHPKDWIGNKNYGDVFEVLDKAPKGRGINLRHVPSPTEDPSIVPSLEDGYSNRIT